MKYLVLTFTKELTNREMAEIVRINTMNTGKGWERIADGTDHISAQMFDDEQQAITFFNSNGKDCEPWLHGFITERHAESCEITWYELLECTDEEIEYYL